ncbi:LacI family DNA-binding transcriptional regulator [Pseudoxanthomonas putridarboris]|uniref:LacI family DNA-binding transcriptional regulator n=1 Tax=Pseudoxanthomonas putridarboris TaxID=752605 RepID=A0ABU9IYQ5_9GAMM
MTDTHSKRPTLKDLAKAASVSLASASYAINGTGSLGEQTRQHVLRVAEDIGYRQNLNARAMRTGRTRAIGLVLPDLSNPFFPSLAQSVIQTARRWGFSVYVTDTEGSEELERDTLKELVGRNVDGLIWFPIRDVDTAGPLIGNVPTIVLDRSLPGFECIQADYALGGQRAVEHLLAAGHRRIGIVSGPTDIASMRQRCEAAAAQIGRHGELAFQVSNAFSTDLEPAVAAAIDNRAATAVFVGADVIAMGILGHAQTHGLKVPDDLSIVGFDDIPWANFSSPPLTTIEMPLEQMASEAVEALAQRIDGNPRASRRIILDTPLISRRSVARPAAA